MTKRPESTVALTDAATLRVAPKDSTPSTVQPLGGPLDADGGDRYETLGILGEGGMGVVYLCRDARIGRHVALKVLQPGEGSHSASRERFQREARVQGQLEHPSIVPVYDVGVRSEGSAFFTMKRLRGLTLAEVIAKLETGDAGAVEAYPPRRLLAIFSQVVQAVAFAHARGVIHRDLKPGNVMLGAFGEVYVLDWGLAKIQSERDSTPPPTRLSAPDASASSLRIEDQGSIPTLAGEILGTPGYMAPEQIEGDAQAIGVETDIYALGAILFEILTLSPLHQGGSAVEILASTLAGDEARPSQRAPDRVIPPELDDICVRATRLEPAERFSSASELHRLVERYLDGARDLVRRREIAHEHVERAQRAVGSLDAQIELDPEARADAMRHLGLALSVDPGNEEAVAALTRILMTVPRRVSPELRAEYEQRRAPTERALREATPLAFTLWAACTLIVLVMGIRDLGAFLLPFGLQVALAVIAWAWTRRPLSTPPPTLLLLVLSTTSIAATSAWMGWAVLMPCLAILNALGFLLARPARARWILVVSAVGLVVPVALEALGVTAPSYEFRDGTLVILPRMTHLPPTLTASILLLSNVVLVLLPGLLVARVSRRLTSAEEQIFMLNWNLQHMLPDAVRGAMTGSAPSSIRQPTVDAGELRGP
jgi:eukaryotic-like serine/threonine-protein kinase